MEVAVVPVFAAGNSVVTSAANAVKALFDVDLISNGTYEVGIDHAVTVQKQYGVFLETELIKICRSKEEANATRLKVLRALDVIDNMEFGQTLSFLNLFEKVEMFQDEFEANTNQEDDLERVDL